MVAKDELEPIRFSVLAGRQQVQALEYPVTGLTALPLQRLDPDVFERLVAELVSYQDNHGVQFYGRRGQKQYGLDVVELRTDGRYTLYQVKRYQSLTPALLRQAVTDYAGPPRSGSDTNRPRRFDPDRFVVVTSALLDTDTANVDELAALRREYAGDLELHVWAADALSRALRDKPRLVYAIFGPDWARAFCGFQPAAEEAGRPKSRGLVDDPVEVLNLDHLVTEAAELAEESPSVAANLYRNVADTLHAEGFPGHAAILRRRESKALLAAGDHAGAFDVLWPLAYAAVGRGEPFLGGTSEDLELAAAASAVLTARLAVLRHAEDWHEHGTQLEAVVESLRTLVDSHDPHASQLACLTLEQVLADGLFQFSPPWSVLVDTNDATPAQLNALVELAATGSDSVGNDIVRARLDCALADAGFTATTPADAVATVYGPLTQRAAAGRYGDAGGLVAARAARAMALHGALDRAEDLWRQSILACSEAGLYGDARAALRSIVLLDGEAGIFRRRQLSEAVAAMPDRRGLLDAGPDPMFGALASAHDGKLPDALADTRRALLRALVAGRLQEELQVWDLLGDVFDAAGHAAVAVHCWVQAGQAKKAATRAAVLDALADVDPWLELPWRRWSDAAVRVAGNQAGLLADDAVPRIVDRLLAVAEQVWASRYVAPHPELSALKALTQFGPRLSDAAVGRLIDIAEPALAAPTRIGDDVARMLATAYRAQPQCRVQLADALSRMLALTDPPDNLWGLLERLADIREPLLPAVTNRAEHGDGQALILLAAWNEHPPALQELARRACSALLRKPVGIARTGGSMTTQEGNTVQLLLGLLNTPDPIVFPPATFTEAKAWTAGGVIMSVAQVPAIGASPAPDPAPTAPPSVLVDQIATISAGSPQELAGAVGAHLLAVGEDALDVAVSRLQSVLALGNLLPRLPAEQAADMAPRLLAVHDDPRLSALDRSELHSDVPLSRFRFAGGAADLAPACLLMAAVALRRAVSVGSLPREDKQDLAGRIVAGALPLLLGSQKYAHWAGRAVHSVATADPAWQTYALALIAHSDDTVRALGAHAAPSDNALLHTLATDQSVRVRRAVADRGHRLSVEIRAVLAADPDVVVRARAAGSTSTE